LRLDRIDLLHLHRVDPAIPLADQVGTLADLRAAGKVRHLALSEVDVEQLAQAQALTPVAAVQNHYNLVSRDHDPVLDACTRAGTAFLPWRPVHPLVSTPDVAAVAADLDATPARVALAWLLARSPVVVPIPGTTSIAHLEENAAAVHLHLDDAHLDRLARI
jgi:aryl-alcohol dehydrogenase-like predicted oxidoreductase